MKSLTGELFIHRYLLDETEEVHTPAPKRKAALAETTTSESKPTKFQKTSDLIDSLDTAGKIYMLIFTIIPTIFLSTKT